MAFENKAGLIVQALLPGRQAWTLIPREEIPQLLAAAARENSRDRTGAER
jgi:hypothetical protein